MSESVEVELDIFSGMPNPEWILPEADAARLRQRIEALPPAPARAPANNLGYRGFIVRTRGEGAETRLLIQHGVVQVTETGTTSYLGDPGRATERWLLDTGRPHLPDEVVALVERELQA